MDIAAIRGLVGEHGKLTQDIGSVSDTQDLFDVGLTSLTTVNLMLALEDHFDVEFEEDMLNRATFSSIEAIADAIETLGA